MKFALSAFRPQWHADWETLAANLDHFVAEAASQGAQLLVFPEYAGLSSVLIGSPTGTPTPRDWRDRTADRAAVWRDLNSVLAQKYRVHILAGSTCERTGVGIVNRAYFCAPDGAIDYQDKLILTPYERLEMGMAAGHEIRVFDTRLGRIGILICYDSEFPLLARSLTEAGAEAILVPSATDQTAGYTRVSTSCRARAIENQCLILQSPLLGPVVGCEVVEIGTGSAGAFCPPDYGLPQDGILALGPRDEHGWTYVDAVAADIAAPRLTGQVGNFSHWPEQFGRAARITRVQMA